MTEPTFGEYREEVQADYGSNTTTPGFNKNAKFKLGDDFLKILQDNAFNRTNGDDVVDHTTKFLAILELIKIPNVDPNQLRLHVFPLSLTGAARKWWIEEGRECFDEHKMKIYGRNISELDDISVSNDEKKELLNEGVFKSEKFELCWYTNAFATHNLAHKRIMEDHTGNLGEFSINSF
ncbi:hypothetical protein Tco_0877518 [Tanacetum coccineum]|uniref:Retrotransposon gag domain-containing protein n=1 Tax=Tanacetum coccineum TaxID=301880 RepID=A0ABQ5BY98_9ASTR